LIWNVVEDAVNKKYWIASDSGLAVYNTTTKTLSYRGHNTEKESLIEKFGSILYVGGYMVDSKERLWFLSWPPTAACRIYCYDFKNNTPVLNAFALDSIIKKYLEPAYLMEQKDGTIWIGGLNVFARYVEDKRSFMPVASGYVKYQGIYYERANLFEDREQNVWVATDNNGVYVFNPAQQLFTSIKHLNPVTHTLGGGGVMSFAVTANNEVLSGAWGDGLYRYDSAFNNIPLAIQGVDEKAVNGAWSMCRLKDNRTIWMVGQPTFIMVYDELTRKVKKYNPPIFENRTIRQVAEDRFGNMWLGTQSRGVYKWIPEKGKNKFEDGFVKVKAIPNTLIEKISVDSKGYIWICTAVFGVYKIDPVTDSIIEQLSTNGPPLKHLLTNDAADAFEYNDSIMIIVSNALNIYNTRNNIITHITSADGLPSDIVMSIEKDKHGYVWLGLLNGLCRMNLEKKTFSYYDRSDGIANDNFTLAASYRLKDGRMLFGTGDDFVVFNPDDVKTSTPPPDVAITGFKLMNAPLLMDSLQQLEKTELTHDDNSLAIEFSALSFLSKNKLIYYYKLEGIDKNWRKANKLNEAVYNYLPPGEYIFKVKCENADGISCKGITTLKLLVTPPFWKTWWFYGMLILACIGFLFWIDKERVKKLEALQKVRTEIAGNLHHDINTTLSSISLLSEMAKIKADKDIVRSKEYIDQINDKSRRMIDSMDDMLWSIDPINDSMEKTILRLTEYAEGLQQQGLNLSMEVDEKVKSQKLDMKVRHELLFIFKEALKLIAGHAINSATLISISFEKEQLSLNIHNSEAVLNVLNPEVSAGIDELNKRAAYINARFDITTDKKSVSV
ncbi:MAG: triple tyrosine motif-containing protein, partial [Panacibacter sp.]